MCYRIDCPPSNIQDVVITDQFGTRAVHDFVASFLCAPAVKGETFCGDGVRQGNEECDGQDAQACGTVKCRPDCTCECTTVCCYIESTVIAIAEAGCFEYTGPIALAALFASQCANGKSIPNGYAKGVVGEGQCVQGPNTGVQCVAGTTPNGIKIPPDTSCN
jgi:hypothetical protein